MALGENQWTFPSFRPSRSLLPVFLPPWCRTEFPAVVGRNGNAVNIYCWYLHSSNTFLALESQLVSVKNRHCLIPSMMCYNGCHIVVISYSDIFISNSLVFQKFDVLIFILLCYILIYVLKFLELYSESGFMTLSDFTLSLLLPVFYQEYCIN